MLVMMLELSVASDCVWNHSIAGHEMEYQNHITEYCLVLLWDLLSMSGCDLSFEEISMRK